MRKSIIVNPVAKLELVMSGVNDLGVPVIAQIGFPYKIDEHSWACPAELKGVDPQYPDIQGASSMQAICLAIRLIKSRLGDLIDDGESIYQPDELVEKLDRAYLDIIFPG